MRLKQKLLRERDRKEGRRGEIQAIIDKLYKNGPIIAKDSDQAETPYFEYYFIAKVYSVI